MTKKTILQEKIEAFRKKLSTPSDHVPDFTCWKKHSIDVDELVQWLSSTIESVIKDTREETITEMINIHRKRHITTPMLSCPTCIYWESEKLKGEGN